MQLTNEKKSDLRLRLRMLLELGLMAPTSEMSKRIAEALYELRDLPFHSVGVAMKKILDEAPKEELSDFMREQLVMAQEKLLKIEPESVN